MKHLILAAMLAAPLLAVPEIAEGQDPPDYQTCEEEQYDAFVECVIEHLQDGLECTTGWHEVIYGAICTDITLPSFPPTCSSWQRETFFFCLQVHLLAHRVCDVGYRFGTFKAYCYIPPDDDCPWRQSAHWELPWEGRHPLAILPIERVA